MPDTATETLSSAVVQSYDLLRDHCGLIESNDISLIELQGDDRKGWLQGQVTNDLRSLDTGASSAFCLCEATGHLLAVCDVWGLADRIFIATQKETAPAVLKRAETMVIMEDVVATDVTDRYRRLSFQGPAASRELGALLALPTLDAGEGEIAGVKVFCLRCNRTGMGGWDVLVPIGEAKAIKALTKGFDVIDPEAADIARLEAGRPVFGRDMNGKTLPPELGPAFEARHISYSKGCYMGQEVLMRIKSRGHTNRTWVALLSEEPLTVGAAVSHPRREDAGVVTSAAWSPDYGYIGSAMLRNEAASDREMVRVAVEGGTVEAEVRQMPILRFD